MKQITLNTSYLGDFVTPEEFRSHLQIAQQKEKELQNKTGAGNDFLGWYDLAEKTDRNLIKEINACANDLKNNSQVIVVVWIWGSYLGSKAIIEMLSQNFVQPKNEIIFAGFTLDEDYMSELLMYLENKTFSIIVISKSGTTTEPALAFRLLREKLISKLWEKHSQNIVAITDEKKWALLELSKQNNYKTFVIPDDVWGRYSVLTPVGLIPIAVAGYDIEKLILGAKDFAKDSDITLEYAAIRNILYKKGKTMEILVGYKEKLRFFIEWWKQLFGESEGKEGKGIFPSGALFSTDLHSMGQYIQDGIRNIFETTLNVEENNNICFVNEETQNSDGLNYLSNKSFKYINTQAMLGTIEAHNKGWVPNIVLNIPKIDEYYIGQLIYFFEKSCAVSWYMLWVNPFDQPGVEEYKKNMFRLLWKK